MHCTCIHSTGKQELRFSSMTEFHAWKEREEEVTYTSYVKDTQGYQPKLMEGRIKMHSYM